MQTQMHQLLRSSRNTLCYLYSIGGTIFYQEYGPEGFCSPQKVIDHVSDAFAAHIHPNGEVYLLAKDNAGMLYFCKKAEKSWNKKVILHTKNSQEIPTKCHISLSQNTLTLLYTIKYRRQEEALYAVQYTDGKWSVPVKIDVVQPVDGQSFVAYEPSPGHILLFYATDRGALHCRELLLTPLTLGSCHSIVQYGFLAKDVSVIFDENKIHMLCLVKTQRGTMQLVYKSKYQSAITPSILLYEDRYMDSCLLMRIKNTLWAFWTTGGVLCYSTSTDNGATFASPVKYQKPEQFPLQKASYYSLKELSFYTTELYINHAGSLCLLPELTSDFFPSINQDLAAYRAQSAQPLNTDNGRYENRLQFLEESIGEKMEQISRLSKDLAERNQQIADLNMQWRTRYQQAAEKIKTLSLENQQLIDELNMYRKEKAALAHKNALPLSMAAADTVSLHNASSDEPVRDTVSSHKTLPDEPVRDTVSSHKTLPDEPVRDTMSSHKTLPNEPVRDTMSSHKTLPDEPVRDTVSSHKTLPDEPVRDTADTAACIPMSSHAQSLTAVNSVKTPYSMDSSAVPWISSSALSVLPEAGVMAKQNTFTASASSATLYSQSLSEKNDIKDKPSSDMSTSLDAPITPADSGPSSTDTGLHSS